MDEQHRAKHLDRFIDALQAGEPLEIGTNEDAELADLYAVVRELHRQRTEAPEWPDEDYPERLTRELAAALKPAPQPRSPLAADEPPRPSVNGHLPPRDLAAAASAPPRRRWPREGLRLAAAGLALFLVTAMLVALFRDRSPQPQGGFATGAAASPSSLPLSQSIPPDVALSVAARLSTPVASVATPPRSLGDLAPAVAAALQLGYGQPLDLKQTVPGATVTLKWAYADTRFVVLYYQIEAQTSSPDTVPSLALWPPILEDQAGRVLALRGGSTTAIVDHTDDGVLWFDASQVAKAGETLRLRLTASALRVADPGAPATPGTGSRLIVPTTGGSGTPSMPVTLSFDFTVDVQPAADLPLAQGSPVPTTGPGPAGTPAEDSPNVQAFGVALPPVGQPFDLPGMAVHNFTLVRAGQAPPFSLQEAMQIVKDSGIPFALGGEYRNQQVTIQAAFGLATFVGPSHIPIHGTNIILDHVENRPMWIIDYGNINQFSSKTAYNMRFDHAVYAVDAGSRTVLYAWTYDSHQQAPVAACISSELEAGLVSIGAAAGHVRDDIELRNTSSLPCSLTGYLGVQLLDARQQPLAVTVEQASGQTYFGRVPAISQITLPPGTATLGSGDHQGHVFFSLISNDVCPNSATTAQAVAGLALTPPGTTQPLIVSAALGNVCDPQVEPVTAEPPSARPATPAADSAPSCRASQLRLAVGDPVSEATGQDTLSLTLTNQSQQACYLEGYPAVSLRNGAGQSLPFDYQQHGDQMVTSQPPRRVDLPPGGRAYVTLNKYRCDLAQTSGADNVARIVELTLPGDATPLRLTLPADSRTLGYCQPDSPGNPGLQVAISPFEPTFEATLAH